MRQPFFIAAFPRSRTAWICNYFTSHGHTCLHEPILKTHSIHDALDIVERNGWGICDSSVPIMWPQIKERFPDAPIAVVLRPDWHKESAVNGKVSYEVQEMLKDRLYPMIKGHVVVEYPNLDNEIKDLALHCVPGFNTNPWIHDQCMRFHIQLTDEALTEAMTPFNFSVERKEAA